MTETLQPYHADTKLCKEEAWIPGCWQTLYCHLPEKHDDKLHGHYSATAWTPWERGFGGAIIIYPARAHGPLDLAPRT